MIRQGSPRRREPDHELLQRVEWPVTVCRIGGWVGCLTRRRTSQPSQQEKRPSSDVVLRSGLKGLTRPYGLPAGGIRNNSASHLTAFSASVEWVCLSHVK